MTIELTTPFSYTPGHGESSVSYAEVKIIFFSVNIELMCIVLRVQYGDTVSGNWTPGKVPIHQILIEDVAEKIDSAGDEIDANPVYSILMGTSLTSDTGVSLYNDVGNNLYQHLIDKGFYTGTIN